MSHTMSLFLMIMILSTMLSILGQTLPTRNKDLEKVHPYECGFDPMKSSRLPFSFRFFLVAILFLLFDLEMALLLPIPLSFLMKNLMKSMMYSTMFLTMLSLGLYMEWVKGGLEWAEN